jgi:DNA-binding IclR family transcriptional regulator
LGATLPALISSIAALLALILSKVTFSGIALARMALSKKRLAAAFTLRRQEETLRSSASVTLQRGVGARLPLATTAMGRAYLAGLPGAERSFLLDQIRLRNAQDWSLIKSGIEQSLVDHAEHGFCISIGEWDKDTCGVAVPFRAPDGVMMAFNCGIPAFKYSREQLQNEVGPALLELVKKVGGSIGRSAS